MTDEKKPKKPRRGRVYLRGSTWWLDFSRNGRRYRQPIEDATSENEAWDALDKVRAEVREGRRPDVERSRFEQLAERLTHHYEAQGARPRSLARAKQALAHLAYFNGTPAREIADNLDAYVVFRRKQGAKPATIRLELGVLGRMFRVARLPRPELPHVEVRNVRQGFFEPAELQAVLGHLPPEVAAVTKFGAWTGWRKSEILGLQWKDVDLLRGLVHLPPGTTKNGQGRTYPVSAHPELARLLQEQRQVTTDLEHAQGRIIPWVFHRAGAPIRDMDNAWKRAVRLARVPGRLFHDLRRTAVRDLERARVPRSVAMKLTGHLTESVFRRYAIVDEADLAEGVSKLTASRFGTSSAQTDDRVDSVSPDRIRGTR
jgi:integrase